VDHKSTVSHRGPCRKPLIQNALRVGDAEKGGGFENLGLVARNIVPR